MAFLSELHLLQLSWSRQRTWDPETKTCIGVESLSTVAALAPRESRRLLHTNRPGRGRANPSTELAALRSDHALREGYDGADVWSLGVILFNLITRTDCWCFGQSRAGRWALP